jgi:hypothetical protein
VTVYCSLLEISGSGKTEQEAKASFRNVLMEQINSSKDKTKKQISKT